MLRVPTEARYFADANLLGFARLLIRAGRTDIVHPGHELLPDVPLDTQDVAWLPRIGAANLVVITRDRRIRTRPAELAAYRRAGIRSVWIGSKRDLGPRDQVDLFLTHEERLNRVIVKLGSGHGRWR